ncbi:TPA: DUF2895 family protein [Shewanella algae]|uniref:DUF2895 family protein n=1 Tax=Shewanella TaxID=22 RepID=UPI00142F4BDE|nr:MULTISPECIES: DUF2895 family protein [Shewanella]NJI86965.1 DUF2895 family protein [Shewanella sp. Iso12]HDS1208459.1 DUF2895 family protein [Shewanella algae]
MFQNKPKRARDLQDKVIRFLTIVLLGSLVLLGHAHYRLSVMPSEFECQVPPDLSNGATIKVNEQRKENLYALAFMIHQKTFSCKSDCATDIPSNIRDYGYYYTTEYRTELLKNTYSRDRGKERTISEQGHYSESKVINRGANTWVVFIDVNVKDYIGGRKVRDAVIRYPYIIVKGDVDREKNPWRLQIAGKEGTERRLDK